MTLTKRRVTELKNAARTAVHKAMSDFTAPDVAGLHKRAIEAAESVRGDNELAYVKVSIKSEDDTAFRIIVDLTSGEDDAFYIDYGVKYGTLELMAIFAGSGDLVDKR